MWADESVFYHIYPLGFCGCEDRNDFSEASRSRIRKIVDWIWQIKKVGANALYLGPIFDSTAHGYDTADYFKLDRRLGTNSDFSAVAEELHNNGIKVVLDGVFNHVGRDFWAFKDVLEHKGYSKYCDWFFIHWDCNNSYNDGFCYDGWEGCYDLVRLNLKNPEVKNHIFEAVKSWVENYDIDGLRLDVAYCLDKDFLRELRSFCKNLKPDFWLMGETLHGDYNQWMNPEMLDSVTNYECYKGLFSSYNSKNLFEIAYSLGRQFADVDYSLYRGKNLFSFIDNHDVSRIYNLLSEKKFLKSIYTLLFAMPGIPCVYYGSEWGESGDKAHGDKALRPYFENPCQNDLTYHIERLSRFRTESKALKWGNYRQIHLTNETFAFARENAGETVICAINIGDKDFVLNYNGFQAVVHPFSSYIFRNGDCVLWETAEFFSATK